MDFTIETYIKLLEILQNKRFVFQPFAGFIQNQGKKVIILRHDVDKLPENSLNIARLESSLGIRGSYYFRIVPCSFNEKIIKNVAELGHEVGYHYEDVSLAAQRQKIKVKSRSTAEIPPRRGQKWGSNKDYEKYLAEIALESFKENLEMLRNIVPIKTICMHGSPRSRWDSRLLWKDYDYHDFGIVAEPYFDINFDGVLYLTDTGRRWDGGTISIRDKGLEIRDEAMGGGLRASGDKEKGRRGEGEKGREEINETHDAGHKTQRINYYDNWKVRPVTGSMMNMTQKTIEFQNKFKFRSTFDIIRTAERGELPDKIMMTFHPQRWTDKPGPWIKELIWQNVKNVGKWVLIKMRD